MKPCERSPDALTSKDLSQIRRVVTREFRSWVRISRILADFKVAEARHTRLERVDYWKIGRALAIFGTMYYVTK